MDYILTSFVLLIVLSCIVNGNNSYDYLSRETTGSVRGIAAIAIVLHHISEKVSGGVIFPYLSIIGYLIVAVFFFYSGYGLLVQKNRKTDYLRKFPKNRILYLLIIYILDVLLYTGYGLINGKSYNVLQILRSLYRADIALNSWYIVVLLYLYAAFYVIFSVFGKLDDKWKILIFVTFQAILVAVFRACSFNPYWYVSNMAFSLGLVWAYKKEYIDEILKSHWLSAFVITMLIFAAFYLLPTLISKLNVSDNSIELTKIICRQISTPMFVAVVMVLFSKIKPYSKLFGKLGGISLEIYLLHGLVYTFFRSDLIYIKNDIIWTLITIAVTVLIAIPVSMLNKQIAKAVKK